MVFFYLRASEDSNSYNVKKICKTDKIAMYVLMHSRESFFCLLISTDRLTKYVNKQWRNCDCRKYCSYSCKYSSRLQ